MSQNAQYKIVEKMSGLTNQTYFYSLVLKVSDFRLTRLCFPSKPNVVLTLNQLSSYKGGIRD